jgi:branched-chain amino acid transport system permease protein
MFSPWRPLELRENSPGMARYRLAVTGVLALVVVAALTSLSPFTLGLITRGIGMGIAVAGLNLAAGHAGQPAFGHSAFMGIGAYAAAIAYVDLSVPTPLLFLVAFVGPLGPGALIGLAASRIKGVYLSIVTLSMAAGFPSLVKAGHSITNGVGGLRMDGFGEAPEWTGLSRDQHWGFLIAVAVAAVCALAIWGIVHSRSGRAMHAMRESSAAATVYGISPPRTLAALYAVSAGFCGVGGIVSALPLQFVAPEDFRLFVSLQLFAALVIGGVRSIGGSIAGGLIVATLPWVSFALDLPLGSDLVVAAGVLIMSQTLRGGLAAVARRVESLFVTRVPEVPELVPFWPTEAERAAVAAPPIGELIDPPERVVGR